MFLWYLWHAISGVTIISLFFNLAMMAEAVPSPATKVTEKPLQQSNVEQDNTFR
jgi:hypothetical protein